MTSNIKKQLSAFLDHPSRSKKRVITCSADIFSEYQTEIESMDRECFIVAGLTSKNEIVGETIVSIGSTDSCPVEPREVFRALVSWARVTRAIVLHNHPSGDCTPSHCDVVLTKRLVDCGKLLGIEVLDHIVIGKAQYASLRDLGFIS
jgi:DNA repair protein RadC